MCQDMFQMISHIYRQYFRGKRNGRETLSSSGDEIESETARLQEENFRLQNEANYYRAKEIEFHRVLSNYDNLLGTMVAERNSVSEQSEATHNHLLNLEKAFDDLLQKYEKAKAVIEGFQKNEMVLRLQVLEYKKLVQNLKIKPSAQRKPAIISAEDSKPKKKRRLQTTI